MIIRKNKLPKTIGFIARIIVDDGNHRVREELKFKTIEELDIFMFNVNHHFDDTLKYLLQPHDTFERIDLFEYTPDGEIYELKFSLP